MLEIKSGYQYVSVSQATMMIGNFSSILSTKMSSGWKPELANVSDQNECPWLKVSEGIFPHLTLSHCMILYLRAYFTHWRAILESSQHSSTTDMPTNLENVSNNKNFPAVCADLLELLFRRFANQYHLWN